MARRGDDGGSDRQVLDLVAVWVLPSEVRGVPRPGSGARRPAPRRGRRGPAGAHEPGIPLLLVAVGAVGLSMSQVETLWQPHFAAVLATPAGPRRRCVSGGRQGLARGAIAALAAARSGAGLLGDGLLGDRTEAAEHAGRRAVGG